MQKMLEAALGYINRGWYVFPLHSLIDGKCSCGKHDCGSPGKHPRVPGGFTNASREPEKIEEWFGKSAPPSNIGVATGEASGITVVDVDMGPGKLGAETWSNIIGERGEPSTLIAKTGGGGLHVIFKYNSVVKTAGESIGAGIDTRNDGGYIVAPPSLHHSGECYSWANEEKIAPLPAYLAVNKTFENTSTKKNKKKSKPSLDKVRDYLQYVSSDSRDDWRNIGIILGREYNCDEEAWRIYNEWSEKWGGKKGPKHNQTMHDCFYVHSQEDSRTGSNLSVGTIITLAKKGGWAPKTGQVPKENFVYYAPDNKFIYMPKNSAWTAQSVDVAVSPVSAELKASKWLQLNRLATSMTSDPRIEKKYTRGFDYIHGKLKESEGAVVYNQYNRSDILSGDAELAKPFLDHCARVFNREGDKEQFLDYMAHRVKCPEDKPRFALLIGGEMGNGKDTAIEFCAPAIGVDNVANIEPAAFEASFNEYVTKTLVRINESSNLHEINKWAFNERTKVLIAGSPDYCEVNPKYGTKYSVRMHCGVIVTTNHLMTGIYIPSGDRRYDVIDTASKREMGIESEEKSKKYFQELWNWFKNQQGENHVAAFLRERDISSFSPDSGQRKTEAHKDVVSCGFETDEWLDDVLHSLNYPDAIRSDHLLNKAIEAGENDRTIRPRLSKSIRRFGYTKLRSDSKDGRWRIDGKKVTVFVQPGVEIDPTKDLPDETF